MFDARYHFLANTFEKVCHLQLNMPPLKFSKLSIALTTKGRLKADLKAITCFMCKLKFLKVRIFLNSNLTKHGKKLDKDQLFFFFRKVCFYS